VAEEVIDDALEAEYSEEQERELLWELARKACPLLPQDDAEKKQRKIASLARRWMAAGFPTGLVLETVKRLEIMDFNEEPPA